MLLGHGHPDAGLYPIAMVRDEAAIVRHRLNMLMVTDATLTQAAILSALSEEGGKFFKELSCSLTED